MIKARYSADIGVAIDTAGVIAVLYVTFVGTYNSADMNVAINTAYIITICDNAAFIIRAYNATNINSITVDFTSIMAAHHDAGVRTHHAACKAVAADGAFVIAVFYSAAVITRYAANVRITAEVRIDHTHITHSAFIFNIAEQTHFFGASVIKEHAGNGLVVAVKGSGVLVI